MEPIQCIASAPGKLILFGEHAVVYGETAIAAVLSDLRVFTRVEIIESDTMEILLLNVPSESTAFGSSVKLSMDMKLMLEIAKTFDGIRPEKPPKEMIDMLHACLPNVCEGDRNALVPVLFLSFALLSWKIIIAKNLGLRIHVKSDSLPVGAGLGSSAAFSVATAAALIGAEKQLRKENLNFTAIDGMRYRPCEDEKILINAWAYASECIMHGTPSGLDNEVSCAGGAVKLTRTDGKLIFESVENFPPIDVMVVNSRVPRVTRELVAGVRVNYEMYPTIVPKILETMGKITERFLEIFSSITAEETLEEVEELVEMNQALLNAVGVGHPALTHICEITRNHSLSTKLTGAGGGGCAFTILGGSGARFQRAKIAKQELEYYNYSCSNTSVGGEGVLWHHNDMEFLDYKKVEIAVSRKYLAFTALALAGMFLVRWKFQ